MEWEWEHEWDGRHGNGMECNMNGMDGWNGNKNGMEMEWDANVMDEMGIRMGMRMGWVAWEHEWDGSGMEWNANGMGGIGISMGWRMGWMESEWEHEWDVNGMEWDGMEHECEYERHGWNGKGNTNVNTKGMESEWNGMGLGLME